MTRTNLHEHLPVAIVGGGPVGLAAAARLSLEGMPFTVFEAGEHAGSAIRAWGHVRLFTPWRYLIDDAGRALLESEGWEAPDPDEIPTGHALVERYVEPLARVSAIAPHLRTDTRVTSVTRLGIDKLKTEGREAQPFVVRAASAGGARHALEARAVIDASGTCLTPNPLGTSGVPVEGEERLSRRLFHGVPDVHGRDRSRYAGKRVAVVGSGHSAFTVLLDLHELQRDSATRLTWLVRSSATSRLFGGEDADGLSERGALGRRMRALAESGELSIETGFRTTEVHEVDGDVVLGSDDGRHSDAFDEVVVATGFRPDFSFARELRLGLDPVVESPVQLAPLIDPNVHSCGTVPPHGFRELSHPEAGYFAVGMKSYGRAPTFLLVTGYEQVRSVVKALAGDLEAASRVELDLPATGVCSTDFAAVDARLGSTDEAGCCAPEATATDDAGCCAPATSSRVEEEDASGCCAPVELSVAAGASSVGGQGSAG